MKKFFKILPFGILLVGIVVGMYYSTQKSGFELRKKASEISGSQFILKGPSTVKPGEKFTVDLILDTSTDPKYTISAADAIVSYSSTSRIPPSECKGQMPQCPSFMAPPEFCLNGTLVQDEPSTPCECAPPPRCVTGKEVTDGSKQKSDEKRFSQFTYFTLLSVLPGKIFDSYPTLPKSEQYPRPLPPEQTGEVSVSNIKRMPEVEFMPGPIPSGKTSPINISGIKNYSASDQGLFNGFSGSDVFATLTFIAGQSGTISIQLGYSGENATDDSNINGFLKDSPVSLQQPVERLLTAPQALTIKINNEQNIITPSTTPPPPVTCGGFAGIQCPNGMECVYPTENSDTVNKIGTPDQMGTCVTRITPTKPISPSGQFYCENPLIGRPAVMPSPRYGSIPFTTDLGIGAIVIDRGGNNPQRYQPAILGKDYKGIQWNYLGSTTSTWSETIPSALTSYTYNTPGTFRPMYRIIGNDDQAKQTCTTEVELVATVGVPLTPTLTPSPSPTPRPITGTVNAQMKFTGYTQGPIEVSLFGMLDLPKPYPYTDTKNNNSLMFAPEQANVPVFLGKGTTNPDGSIRITVGKEYLNKPYYLFVETPLHLRKYQISNPKPVVLIPDCTGEICTTEIKNLVTFGELVPGDINGDTYGKKDQIINSFDVSVLYTKWSGADEKEVGGFSDISKKPAGNADLNRDGVVNTRDLALLLTNFNKRGEIQPVTVAPTSILDRYGEGMIGPPVNLNLPNP